MNKSLQNATIFPICEDVLPYKQIPLFGSFKWIDVLQQEYGINFYVIKHKKSEAFFPFAHLVYPRFEKIVSLPFSDYAIPSVSRGDVLAELLSDLEKSFPKAKIQCKWVFPEHFNFEKFSYKARQAAYLHTVYTPGMNEVEENMKSSFLGKVRQAKRYNLSTDFFYDLQSVKEFYGTYHELRINKFSKIPQSFTFFEKIWKKFIETRSGFVLKVKLEDTYIAFAICLEFENTIYYKFSCSKIDYLDYRPNNLLLYTLFKYACDNNFKTVDLGLSGTGKEYEGLIHFKESVGGVPSPIMGLEIVPECYNSSAERELSDLTTALTDQIVGHHPAPEVTSSLSKSIYPHFA